VTTETVTMTDRKSIPWTKKINPLWWLVGPDGWDPPLYNNVDPTTGQPMPYLPNVKNIWLRRFFWFVCRNPLMNFVAFVLGVEDVNYTVTGTAPVLKTTGRDCDPQQLGFRFAHLSTPPSYGWVALAALCEFGFVFADHWSLALPAIFCFLRGFGYLPFVSYWNGKVEVYCGWRPASGGFGTKFVIAKNPASQQ